MVMKKVFDSEDNAHPCTKAKYRDHATCLDYTVAKRIEVQAKIKIDTDSNTMLFCKVHLKQYGPHKKQTLLHEFEEQKFNVDLSTFHDIGVVDWFECHLVPQCWVVGQVNLPIQGEPQKEKPVAQVCISGENESVYTLYYDSIFHCSGLDMETKEMDEEGDGEASTGVHVSLSTNQCNDNFPASIMTAEDEYVDAELFFAALDEVVVKDTYSISDGLEIPEELIKNDSVACNENQHYFSEEVAEENEEVCRVADKLDSGRLFLFLAKKMRQQREQEVKRRVFRSFLQCTIDKHRNRKSNSVFGGNVGEEAKQISQMKRNYLEDSTQLLNDSRHITPQTPAPQRKNVHCQKDTFPTTPVIKNQTSCYYKQSSPSPLRIERDELSYEEVITPEVITLFPGTPSRVACEKKVPSTHSARSFQSPWSSASRRLQRKSSYSPCISRSSRSNSMDASPYRNNPPRDASITSTLAGNKEEMMYYPPPKRSSIPDSSNQTWQECYLSSNIRASSSFQLLPPPFPCPNNASSTTHTPRMPLRARRSFLYPRTSTTTSSNIPPPPSPAAGTAVAVKSALLPSSATTTNVTKKDCGVTATSTRGTRKGEMTTLFQTTPQDEIALSAWRMQVIENKPRK